jgi:hypothetical protein
MLKLIFPILLSMSFPCVGLADSIKCYAGNKIIYHREVKNVNYTGEMFIFQEVPSNRTVFYTGNCLFKINS